MCPKRMVLKFYDETRNAVKMFMGGLMVDGECHNEIEDW